MRVSSPKGLKFGWHSYLKGTLNESSMLKSFLALYIKTNSSSYCVASSNIFSRRFPQSALLLEPPSGCQHLRYIVIFMFYFAWYGCLFLFHFPIFCLAKLEEFIWHLIFLFFFCYYKYFPFVCGGRGVDFLRIAFSSCHIPHRNANCY